MYRRLDSQRIIETSRRLRSRIAERFPESGLSRIAAELETIAQQTAKRTARIQRPNWLLRLVALALTGVMVWIGFEVVRRIDAASLNRHLVDALDFFQLLESVLGSTVFLGAAMFFVWSLDARIKRGRALDAIYELRSLAHVVDMHQLTKDPERIVAEGVRTPSSPERRMTPFELGRYLDYCTELLSLISKIAVLYVQGVKDEDVLDAVDQIETLTTGLSRKIWQKIALLDRIKTRETVTLPPSDA